MVKGLQGCFCLAQMISQLSQQNHRCLMVAIINNRAGKHSRTGKAGAATKQHETQPSSGRIKIHLVARYCSCCCRKLSLPTSLRSHTAAQPPPLEQSLQKSSSGMMLGSLYSDLIFFLILGVFRLKILIYTKLYTHSAAPFNLVTM